MAISTHILENSELTLPQQFPKGKKYGGGGFFISKTVRPFIFCRFEQEFLNDMMKKYDKTLQRYFWTGLRDTHSHGEYSWATAGGGKQAVTFSNWNFLEPGESLTKG